MFFVGLLFCWWWFAFRSFLWIQRQKAGQPFQEKWKLGVVFVSGTCCFCRFPHSSWKSVKVSRSEMILHGVASKMVLYVRFPWISLHLEYQQMIWPKKGKTALDGFGTMVYLCLCISINLGIHDPFKIICLGQKPPVCVHWFETSQAVRMRRFRTDLRGQLGGTPYLGFPLAPSPCGRLPVNWGNMTLRYPKLQMSTESTVYSLKVVQT